MSFFDYKSTSSTFKVDVFLTENNDVKFSLDNINYKQIPLHIAVKLRNRLSSAILSASIKQSTIKKPIKIPSKPFNRKG